jgi:hypothetical protein
VVSIPQACTFHGHDESKDSNNQGNFLEMVKLLVGYDDEVKALILDNALGNMPSICQYKKVQGLSLQLEGTLLVL